jgi:hypothetical protein
MNSTALRADAQAVKYINFSDAHEKFCYNKFR